MDILEILKQLFGLGFLTASMRLGTPLLLGALGACVTERSGVFNVGIEGMMLIGAFFGSTVSAWTGNLWLGILAAIVSGALTAFIFGFFSVTLKTNQIVTGLAINILSLGITSLLLRVLFYGAGKSIRTPSFTPISIPLLRDIPIVGPVLFDAQEPLTYIALFLVPLTWYFLYRTRLGVSLRAVGEHARAADTVGINVEKMRYIGTVISGGLAGMGGAFISLSVVHVFQDNMILGRGFIALAVAIFGNWQPFRILLAAILFGAMQSLEYRVQVLSFDISAQLPAMIPYILTLLALTGFTGKITPPAEDGIPYLRE